MRSPGNGMSWSRDCSCGSRKPRRPLLDARGIFCAYVCDACEARKRGAYRAEIFEDAAYEADDLGDDGEAMAEERAARALPVYGEMCRHPEKCEGIGYCPLDPTCAD